MRNRIKINNNWKYSDSFRDEYIQPSFSDRSWEDACLPHTNKVLPYNGFDESEYQFISAYRRELSIPAAWKGRRVFLRFEGVMIACDLWIDGKTAGGHEGGYTAFDLDITDLVVAGRTHSLAVRVDSNERKDIPPYGHVVDYLTFGGIYRDAWLYSTDSVYMENPYFAPADVLKSSKALNFTADLKNLSGAAAAGSVKVSLKKEGRLIAEKEVPVSLDGMNGSLSARLEGLEGIELWDTENPVLYDAEAVLTIGGESADSASARTGFRTAEFTPKGFLLNGKKFKIRGLNRHQAFPYMGYAMPERAQKNDADNLKNSLGLNAVRSSHYPASVHFLDRCDEIGLLVFEEIPGWQHIGDKTWQVKALRNVEEMILNDRNHPSIILWGVRINESNDNSDLYNATNAKARVLDPHRQTSGVRCIEKSEFLEDVYAMNDFVHNGVRVPLRSRKETSGKRNIPYLVSEYNGHMYPTKRFDNEQMLREHALRHTRVIDKAAGDDEICGTFGWCAYDYNTHKDFGSGDRICYHGVSDMFRVPKWAAAAYASQKDPEKGVVMEAASLFTKGERDASLIMPIEVYTNCDYIKIYKGDTEIGTYYPDRNAFPNLAHPPVIIRELIGNQLENRQFSKGDVRIMKKVFTYLLTHGAENLKLSHKLLTVYMLLKYKLKFQDLEDLYMEFDTGWGQAHDSFRIAGFVGGEEKISRTYGPSTSLELTAAADDTALKAGDWDTTRVEYRVVDQNGHLSPYAGEVLSWEISGPGEIIGPMRSPLYGGAAAVWVKTSGDAGEIVLKGRTERLEAPAVAISVK